MREAEDILISRGVKPTANRILVLSALIKMSRPSSLADIEVEIGTMDRSSVFRSLNLFLDKDIVHGIDDGSGSLKYEVCHGDGHCSLADMHVHFHCEVCHATICIESLPVPLVKLPAGFDAHSVNYIIKGICPSCNKN